MIVRTARPASEELAEAVRWYERQRPGLGGDLFDAVATSFSRIESDPELGTPISPDRLTRRVLVNRFPYQVVYRIRANEIVIVAVAHLKRHPRYWTDRI